MRVKDKKEKHVQQDANVTDLVKQVRQGLLVAGGRVPVKIESPKPNPETHIHELCKKLRQGLLEAGGSVDEKDENVERIMEAVVSDPSSKVKQELLMTVNCMDHEGDEKGNNQKASAAESNMVSSNNFAEQVRIGLQKAGEDFITDVVKDDMKAGKKEEKLVEVAKNDFSSQLLSLREGGNNDDWIMEDDEVSIVTLDTETSSDNSLDLKNFDLLEDNSMWLAK